MSVDVGHAPDGALEAGALLERIGRQRDRTAFVALFEAYAPRIKGYLMRLGASAAAAEELTQETMLTVWRRAETFDPTRGSGSTWLYVVARNCRIDALRRERVDLAYDIDDHDAPDPAPNAEAAVSEAQMGEGVRAAMSALSPEQREVVTLSFFEDKPHSEIAAQLGLPLGTVKSRLRLAMNHMRAKLESTL